MNISKYFWGLNENALRETEKILRSPQHPQFAARIVTLLSRCDKPRELFLVIPKEKFVEIWPKIRAYWMKHTRESEFRDWWETIFEQLLEANHLIQKKVKGKFPGFFQKFGILIREARIEKGLNQKQLADAIGMKQPDISRIEEGKKNITLFTLMRLCKILEIKKVDTE
jgi:DNA-binding Xre family transcriptional regulator